MQQELVHREDQKRREALQEADRKKQLKVEKKQREMEVWFKAWWMGVECDIGSSSVWWCAGMAGGVRGVAGGGRRRQ